MVIRQQLGNSPRMLVLIGLGVAVSLLFPSVPPSLFLLSGMAIASFRPIESKSAGKWSKGFLSVSIVLMGFGIPIGDVLQIGVDSFFQTLIGVVCVLSLGLVLTQLFRIPIMLGCLISAGTAICGGSAIAAVSSSMNASHKSIAQSTLIVFTLNGIALFLFPKLGHFFEMSQESFGMWSALAIHDTSSVVGAAGAYGEKALELAVTVKLVRSLWVFPVALAVGWMSRSQGSGPKFPLFIIGFITAAAIHHFIPSGADIWVMLSHFGKSTLCLALLMVGLQMNMKDLKEIGWRPFMMASTLWICTSIASAWILMR